MITPTYAIFPGMDHIIFCNICGSLIRAELLDAHTRWHRSLEGAQTSIVSKKRIR